MRVEFHAVTSVPDCPHPPRGPDRRLAAGIPIASATSAMNEDDQDALDTLQFVAQDTEVLPYDDGLETCEQTSLPCEEDEDPTTQIAISGEITI